jgi:hypothetical protein
VIEGHKDRWNYVEETVKRDWTARPSLFGPVEPILELLKEARQLDVIPGVSMASLSFERGPMPHPRHTYVWSSKSGKGLFVGTMPENTVFCATVSEAVQAIDAALNKRPIRV